MEKPLATNQLTACDVSPGGPCRTDAVADQDVRRPCAAYKLCERPGNPDDGLCSLVRWQEYHRDLMARPAEAHRRSNEIEYNVQRAVNTLSASADKANQDITNRMSSTAKNIGRWRLDVLQNLTNMRNEIDLLMLSRKKIQTAQMALGIICSISTECLERRSFRLGFDLTLDQSQIELVKESELINEIGELMCRTLCQLNDQIIRNKQMKYRLEENWSNKDQSYKIEASNLELNIQSPIIMPDVAALTNSENACTLSLSEWVAANKSLHDEAERVFDESVNFRHFVDEQVLKSGAKRLRDQADAVDMAMARYISDTQQISRAIENDLEQLVQRLSYEDDIINDPIRAITNMEKMKMTAETRLHNRLKRPEDDCCKDGAHLSLMAEVKNLDERLKTLNDQLQSARTGYVQFQEVRGQFQNEARIKRKTLWIDCVRCQRVRAYYPSQTVLIGHN